MGAGGADEVTGRGSNAGPGPWQFLGGPTARMGGDGPGLGLTRALRFCHVTGQADSPPRAATLKASDRDKTSLLHRGLEGCDLPRPACPLARPSHLVGVPVPAPERRDPAGVREVSWEWGATSPLLGTPCRPGGLGLGVPHAASTGPGRLRGCPQEGPRGLEEGRWLLPLSSLGVLAKCQESGVGAPHTGPVGSGATS